MLSRVKKYSGSFEMFVQVQYGLRRRILEYYYKWFRKLIVRKINQYSKNAISNEEFINNITSILNIPNNIKIDEAGKDLIIRSADKTVNGIYNLLGSGDVALNPIEWHTDFKTGFRWAPGTFYRRYKQEGIDNDSDVKVPRELSRSHHLLKVGLAYKLTKNEKYAEFCTNQMEDWIDENPLMYSINWGCTMDVSIRAVNWIWTLGLISGSKELDNIKIWKIKSSLYQHGWFIYRNPEKSLFNSGNHYLADLAGHINLALLFKNMEEPCRWLEEGIKELFREIRMEILPSGMSYERSTNYNRLVLELILVPVLLLKSNNQKIPSDIWYRLEQMFEFIMYSLKPDGTSPIIGDQDNGRLLPLGTEETNNFRYLLSLGGLLFNRADFKQYGKDFNIYCSILGGEEAFERWNNISSIPSDLESQSFSDAGIYIMRERDNYLLLNATGKGLYPELGSTGSHTHSDLLSFELFTQGKSFLVDPGSYVYTADVDQRILFRSTKMHNTVTIDGESQDILPREVWGISNNASFEVLKWNSNNDQDIVTAVHNGYSRLTEPVLHERTIIFDKINEKWVIRDTISGEGYHSCEWYFHFDTGIDFEINGNKVETNCADGKNIILIFDNVPGLSLKKEGSFVSKSYGTKMESNVLVARIEETVPVKLEIEIVKQK